MWFSIGNPPYIVGGIAIRTIRTLRASPRGVWLQMQGRGPPRRFPQVSASFLGNSKKENAENAEAFGCEKPMAFWCCLERNMKLFHGFLTWLLHLNHINHINHIPVLSQFCPLFSYISWDSETSFTGVSLENIPPDQRPARINQSSNSSTPSLRRRCLRPTSRAWRDDGVLSKKAAWKRWVTWGWHNWWHISCNNVYIYVNVYSY